VYKISGFLSKSRRKDDILMKRKNSLVGIAFLALGILLSAGTAWLFPTCGPKEDGSWMKCHWSGQVTIGIGIVIVVIALAYLFFSDDRIRAGLSLVIIPVGALEITVLNGLIGLCGMAEMQCRAVTKPAATIIVVVLVLIAIVNAVWLLNQRPYRQTVQQ
jgi:hypothetical protein